MGRRALIEGETEKLALRRFFGLAFLLSWGVGGVYLLARAAAPTLLPLDESAALLVVMSCAPTLAALICAWRERSLGALWQSFLRPFNPIWLLVALTLIPALVLAIALAAQVAGASWPVSVDDVLVRLPLLLFGTAQIVTNAGPIGEELGWRGYALPRLLNLTTPLRASLILGAVWCVWHVPAFFLGNLMAPEEGGLLWWCVGTLALTVIMTWLYLRANGNVVVAGVAPHFVINGAGVLGVWISRPLEAGVLAVVALVIVLAGGLAPRRA